MCQLLAMNCNVPTDICFSFTGFQARGGLTDVHSDGWGIAFFEGKGFRTFLDPAPSFSSPIAELMRAYPIKSKNVIAHIRKATQGIVNLENTHPFQRELWGEYWLFAHNGNLEGFTPRLDGSFRPVGSTDSEKAFCYIMAELKKRFGDTRPDTETLFEALTALSLELAQHGEFNFVLSNGEALFCHCSSKLAYIVRRAPFGAAALKDQDITVDFQSLTTPDDCVAMIATTPLTENETWTVIEPGTLMMFRQGVPVQTSQTIAHKPKSKT
ncbi:MAG: class II glutamine amidotransferase [Bdellovibrionales bacterium]|jgi:glutamine amidotransferase|nr:class II glutamine amidotransferase [Bdellovibrionales bacterium]